MSNLTRSTVRDSLSVAITVAPTAWPSGASVGGLYGAAELPLFHSSPSPARASSRRRGRRPPGERPPARSGRHHARHPKRPLRHPDGATTQREGARRVLAPTSRSMSHGRRALPGPHGACAAMREGFWITGLGVLSSSGTSSRGRVRSAQGPPAIPATWDSTPGSRRRFWFLWPRLQTNFLCAVAVTSMAFACRQRRG